MFNKFSRSVPAKDVQMQHLHSTDTVPDAPASTPGEGAKYDDYKDGKLKFFNRMIICGIAVVLLWCTSLSIAGNESTANRCTLPRGNCVRTKTDNFCL